MWRKAEKRHIVLKGPPQSAPDEWITVCGWKFGASGKAVPPLAAHPMCTKCRKAAVVGHRGQTLHAQDARQKADPTGQV